jgi:hypothetical protein
MQHDDRLDSHLFGLAMGFKPGKIFVLTAPLKKT